MEPKRPASEFTPTPNMNRPVVVSPSVGWMGSGRGAISPSGTPFMKVESGRNTGLTGRSGGGSAPAAL